MISDYINADQKQTKDNNSWTPDPSGKKLGLWTGQIYYGCNILLLMALWPQAVQNAEQSKF